MQGRSETHYSYHLGRDMTFEVYGYGGKPALVFPSQNGRPGDFNGFHMTDTIADRIERGEIQLFCVDSVDEETVSAVGGNPYDRIRRHEAWYQYIMEELVPLIRQENGSGQKLLSTGVSMGAYHAGNFFFRRPDVFDSVIALSGVYDTDGMYGDYHDELVYYNSPIQYLRNLPAGHPYFDLYAQCKIIICVGQGAWEAPLLESTRILDGVLREKGIAAWVDYWGFDVNHDWPWWQKQFPYFLSHILS